MFRRALRQQYQRNWKVFADPVRLKRTMFAIFKCLIPILFSEQMAKSFEILEARLTVQLNQIRSMIQGLISPQSYAQPHYVRPSMLHGPVVNQQFSPQSIQYAPPQNPPQYPIGQAYQQYLPAVHILQSSTAPYLQEIPTDKLPLQPLTTTSKPIFYSTHKTNSPETTTVSNSYPSTVASTVSTTERTLKFQPVQLKSLGRILKPKSLQR